MIYRYLKVIPVLCLAFLTGCSMMTTTREHPALEEELRRIERVVVAPPSVELQQLNFSGNYERLKNKEDLIGNHMMGLAYQELIDGGYEVVDFDFEEAREQDEDFAFLLTQVEMAFAQAKGDLRHGAMISAANKRDFAASLGPAAFEVAERSGADAILLMHYTGWEKSKGMIAKDVGVGVLVGVLTMGSVVPTAQTSAASIEAVLIDGLTGEVLWTDTRAGILDRSLANQAMKSMPDDVDPGDPVPEK